MRTHGEIIKTQDAILAETQKWMKMAKMELNHKREVVADREKTILNQGITICQLNHDIEKLEEEINDLKEALLNASTKITELSMENAKLSIYKTLVDQSIIHVRR